MHVRIPRENYKIPNWSRQNSRPNKSTFLGYGVQTLLFLKSSSVNSNEQSNVWTTALISNIPRVNFSNLPDYGDHLRCLLHDENPKSLWWKHHFRRSGSGPRNVFNKSHRYFGLQVNLGKTILYFLCLLSNIFILLSLSLLTSNSSRYFSFLNHLPSVIPLKVTTIFLVLSSKLLTMAPVQSSLQITYLLSTVLF